MGDVMQVQKRGRPRKDFNVAICRGIVVQPRFPRWLHRHVRAAAKANGVTMTRWILDTCVRVLCEAQGADALWEQTQRRQYERWLASATPEERQAEQQRVKEWRAEELARQRKRLKSS